MLRLLQILVFLVLLSTSATADNLSSFSSIDKAVVAKSYNKGDSSKIRYYTLVKARQGVEITIISNKETKSLSSQVKTVLLSTHKFLEEKFGKIPKFYTSIEILNEEEFFRKTNAPRWTNALYYKGKIIIPVSDIHSPYEIDNLARSVRHEYSHAVINALTKGRCPGWLDEGLAQLLEGRVNPALKPALIRWLNVHNAVPLSLLQGGFTKLDSYMVPPAYAQSLFAVNAIIETYNFKGLKKYFALLRNNQDKNKAFQRAFYMTEKEFEKQLNILLKNWWEKEKNKRSIQAKNSPSYLTTISLN